MENEKNVDLKTSVKRSPQLNFYNYSSHNEQVILKALAKTLWYTNISCTITDDWSEGSNGTYDVYICLSKGVSHIWSVGAQAIYEKSKCVYKDYDDVLDLSIQLIGYLTNNRDDRIKLLELFRLVLIEGDYIVRVDD